MPVLYRYIKYESPNQDYLDEQIGRSLKEGVHKFPNVTITVRDSTEDRCERGFFETVSTPNKQG